MIRFVRSQRRLGYLPRPLIAHTARSGAAWLIVLLLAAPPVWAHELRPAYLELREAPAGEFHALWKTPMLGNARLALDVELSGDLTNVQPISTQTPPGAALQTWRFRTQALRGQTLRIRGLEGTMTDALVRVAFADGSVWTRRLSPREPAATIPSLETVATVARRFFAAGLDHTRIALDQLLLVLALLIVARSRRRGATTVAAFMLARGITMGLAALGIIDVPQTPAQAIAALGIVFLAGEIVHRRQGHDGLTATSPWLVGFLVGLPSGLASATALSATGVPSGELPSALLWFNFGANAGLLLFVATAALLIASARRLRFTAPPWAELLPPYAIGSVATFLVLQRIAAF